MPRLHSGLASKAQMRAERPAGRYKSGGRDGLDEWQEAAFV